MTRRPEPVVPVPLVRSQSDLEAVWKQLMAPLGFGGASVWMLLIDADDRPHRQLTEFIEADEPPDERTLDSLAQVMGGFAGSGLRLAFLRSRPGPGGLTADDKEWARSLYAAGRRAGVPVEVVHRACDHDLVPVPMDEVA